MLLIHHLYLGFGKLAIDAGVVIIGPKTMSADLGLQQSLEVRLLPITLAHHAPPLCAPHCSSWVATRSCEQLSLRPNLQMHSSSTAT